MEEEMDLGLLVRSALPIDDIDQLLIPPSDGMSIIWVDISERPDLTALTERSEEPGYAVCTWFYGNPGKRNMLVGLRIAMRQPTKAVLVLVFKVERFIEQLSTIARYGKLWIVPGPPPAHLVGTQEMDARTFTEKVINVAGQGLLVNFDITRVFRCFGEAACETLALLDRCWLPIVSDNDDPARSATLHSAHEREEHGKMLMSTLPT